MADLEFIKREIARFKTEHPATEGWFVQRISPGSRNVFISRLPAFLRAKLPGNFEEDIATDVWYYMPRNGRVSRRRLTGLPHKSRAGGMHEDDWSGDLRFMWKNSPVHVRRIWVHANGTLSEAPDNLSLMAYKDWKGFGEFYKEGIRFATDRPKSMKKSIYVVNDANYPRPKASWDELVLPAEMKRQIRSNIESFLVAKEKYLELGLPYRRGFLFLGPPGNGKTLVTKVIASEYAVNMATVSLKSDIEERTIEAAFKAARDNPPCVLLFEDLDKMINTTRVSLSYLLNRLDGLNTPEGILVIATTNEPGRLDPALLQRPSRFDRVWEFQLPGPPERLALLQMKGARYFSPEALRRAAEASGGFSMAYVQEAIVSALMAAVHENAPPRDEHLDEAVRQLRSQIKSVNHGVKRVAGEPAVGFSANGH